MTSAKISLSEMRRCENTEPPRCTALKPDNGGKLGGFVSEWEGKAVCVLHNASTEEQSVDLPALTGRSFSVLAASIGQGKAALDGTKLTLGPQTSAVLREG